MKVIGNVIILLMGILIGFMLMNITKCDKSAPRNVELLNTVIDDIIYTEYYLRASEEIKLGNLCWTHKSDLSAYVLKVDDDIHNRKPYWLMTAMEDVGKGKLGIFRMKYIIDY